MSAEIHSEIMGWVCARMAFAVTCSRPLDSWVESEIEKRTRMTMMHGAGLTHYPH